MTTCDEFLAQVKAVRQMCKHMNFKATNRVARLTSEDGATVTGFMVEGRIVCADCGHPFIFKGLPYGLIRDGAAVNIDGEEARLYIEPSDFALQRTQPSN